MTRRQTQDLPRQRHLVFIEGSCQSSGNRRMPCAECGTPIFTSFGNWTCRRCRGWREQKVKNAIKAQKEGTVPPFNPSRPSCMHCIHFCRGRCSIGFPECEQHYNAAKDCPAFIRSTESEQ